MRKQIEELWTWVFTSLFFDAASHVQSFKNTRSKKEETKVRKVLEWLRWFFWGRRHGESVSAFDVRRATQNAAPDVEIAGLRIPRGLVYALVAIVAIGVIVFLVSRLGGAVFTTTRNPVFTASGFETLSSCVVRETASSRTYVAIDCLGDVVADWLWAQVPAVLVFAVGAVFGWWLRGLREKSRKEA